MTQCWTLESGTAGDWQYNQISSMYATIEIFHMIEDTEWKNILALM